MYYSPFRYTLVEWVECLGVVGTLAEIPLSLGWGASMELIGSVRILTLLSLSLVAGGVTPPIGITDNIDSTFIGFKESEECTLNFPSEFHGCASACSLKCEGRGLGLIIDLVLLSMELSGNLTQYESGSDAGWSIVPVFHTFPCTSLTNTGCPGSNSMMDHLEALGCLLSSSW